MSSWGDHDDDNRNCCQWNGVRCDNQTGHVVKLNLPGVDTDVYEKRCLVGKLNSSLVNLKHLSYLDLSYNYFQQQPIPNFIGSFRSLKHLNLSYAGFYGEIPPQIGNLSSLISLDLRFESFEYYSGTGSQALSWLSHLTLLRYFKLSSYNLSEVTEWPQIINNLPFLRVLTLDDCELEPSLPLPLSFKNSSTTLSSLSLVENHLDDSFIFPWLFNFSGMTSTLHILISLISNNQINGPLPTALGNLSALSFLSLSANNLQGTIPSFIENMQSLSHLNLAANNFQGRIPSFIGNLQSLSYLELWVNKFEGPIPDTLGSIKTLTYLNLALNNFQSIPKTLGKYLCTLQEFYFSNNNLTDELPNIIQTLSGCASKSLLSLGLSRNNIWGSVPDTINTFSSLRYLDLSWNQLNGTVSPNLGQLSMLDSLYLTNNSLKGTLSDIHFSNLSRLNYLDLSYNTELAFTFDSDWVPAFQLESIGLRSCNLGPSFPKWLVSQTNYEYLDISNAGISDSIPESFYSSLPSKLSSLNMSYNKISGRLNSLQIPITSDESHIDMSHNNIEGAIPSFPANLTSLLLNNNRFTDPRPFLCLEDKSYLSKLDLSNNLLSGKLPDCWMNFDQLIILYLDNNNFSGDIPASVGYLKRLQELHLRHNNFSEEFPRSLEDCTSLVLLDLSYNSLNGHIQSDIGSKFNNLSFLSLRSNNFVGEIPLSLCEMSFLQILDLAMNQITGLIPKCIHNLTAMQNATDLMPEMQYREPIPISDTLNYYEDFSATILWKSKERSFLRYLRLIKYIDLSNNKLKGDIPSEIAILDGLISLNLSRNNLAGSITPRIGELTSLEVLDLSNNHISGEIPTSLANLNSLSILDLSNNNFSGEIPKGTQLQGFNASSYIDNPELCGPPLGNCSSNQPPYNTASGGDITPEEENDNKVFLYGLCISMVLGFVIGFWGVCGTLVLKRSWRHAFFQFFDDMQDRVYGWYLFTRLKFRRGFEACY
ncbi:LOW QUALITY PROTEIN: receptor-like protein EIX2 [Beta vulgaris subsp. vulgaris]|uniref:LOW QUALITY PROTEIN: receptor-like protein EIX2 n=1 Tax=Beta vulgaris subsp. vulgaris TaxID=3555 RepID=UPI0025475397|nr:LOW QUALITY PROTEIN: receptor-like protein EIX2 [Beta vulgaris subsp. vulgaris]